MGRMVFIVTAALMACAMATSSFAAGTPRRKAIHKAIHKAPAAAPATSTSGTSGFYGGLLGGYGWGRTSLSDAGGSSGFGANGWMMGLTLGYNAQSGFVIYGLEGDISSSWMKGTNGAAAPCAACQVRDRFLGTARARLGYAVGKALPYITAGLAVGDLRTSTPAGASQSDTKTGWTVGGGVEYALEGAWSTKLEYLYVDLAHATCGAAICATATDIKFRANLVRLGINYRF
jgi:outer membrane immunogenic protein